MSLFDINEHFLQQRFPGLELDYGLLVETLNLDLAHLQLLGDCYQNWHKFDLPAQFWLYMLLLVDEINRGSSCVDMSSSRFQQQQKRLNLVDFTDLNVSIEQLTLADMPVIVHHRQFLFFEKYHHAEQTLYRQIEALINDYQGNQYDKAAIQAVLKPVFNSLNYPLNQEQIQAVITALLKPFSLVSGGPGTGKTTMVASLLRCLNALGVPVQDMALAAPTGRAAYRMTASLQFGLNQGLNNDVIEQQQTLAQLEAQTIHRLIGKSNRFNRDNRYHQNHKLPFKVIIIDEVSMVDLQLMTELLAAVDSQSRLILVGDQFQLPSVESGAVLADLMPPVTGTLPLSPGFADMLSEIMAPFVDSTEPLLSAIDNKHQGLLIDSCTVLKQSHRSIASIQNISECVRVGDAAGFFKHPDLMTMKRAEQTELQQTEGVLWLSETADKTAGLEAIWHWFSHHLNLQTYKNTLENCQGYDDQNIKSQQANLDRLFQHINNQQILTLVNQGFSGQQLINRYICQQIKQQWQLDIKQNHFHGQAVTMRHNDYDKQLFNGDVGLLLQSADGWRAVFPSSAGYRSFALPLLPDLATAFAITVHKSQGSEYQHVLMPLPSDINNRLLTREIIYTGMTRAKSSILIYGNQAVLSKAIGNHSERQSGLQFW